LEGQEPATTLRKALLRWFNESNDPETPLQELWNQNQASSPLLCVKHETIISDESDGEWLDEDGQRNDLDSNRFY